MQETEIDDTDTDADTDAPPEATTTATAPRSETRYPLAYDGNGNPLQVPAEAVAWRVRRGGGKRGRPRHVFDASTGRQLEVALGASVQDLAETNVPADRYLLYPIDAQGSIIPGVVAVTEVTEGDDDGGDDEPPAGVSVQARDPVLAMAAFQQETIKGQQETIKTLSAELARGLGSAVSGYAPVRPQAPMAPAPIIMEQPAPQAPDGGGGMLNGLMNMKPEQAMQIGMFIKQMIDMIKNAGSVGGGGIGGVAGGP